MGEEPKGKYLDLLESLQEAGPNSEKEKIELEVQNGSLAAESDEIIDNIIAKYELMT